MSPAPPRSAASFLDAGPIRGQAPGMATLLRKGVQVVADRFSGDLCFDAGEAIERAGGMPTPIDPTA